MKTGNRCWRLVEEEELQIVACRKREDLASLYKGVKF